MSIAALILAGGRGSRLGADVPKPMVVLHDRPLLAHVLDAVPPPIGPILLSANEDDAFRHFGLQVLPDLRRGFQGPLAGMEAAVRSGLFERCGTTHLLVLPGDTPFLTRAVLEPLLSTLGALPRIAFHRGRLQPAVGLWPLAALDGLTAFLDTPGSHAILTFLDRTGFEAVGVEGDDPFFNINTPEDLEAARLRPSCG